MLSRRKLRPGSLRWVATALLAASLVFWLGPAFVREATATGSPGMLWLRSGCLQVVYPVHELPPNINVTTLIIWPSPSEYGIELKEPRTRWVQWWPVSTIQMSTAGALTTTNGPNPITTVASGNVRRAVVIPLWPAVILVGAAAMSSWRRHLRAKPGLCPSCGYSRAGLAPDAKCPECGAVAGN